MRTELAGLGKDRATTVARHLVMAGRLVDTEPERAREHAQAAKRLGARIAVVREAVGLVAYHCGLYQEALAELRTVRRLTGSSVHLPVMADCERGLGRPERALALAADPAVGTLDRDGQVEMLLVSAGARNDLGQHAAAVVTLQVPWLQEAAGPGWLPRLRAAYAAALDVTGRTDEARTWWERAAAVDADGVSGAAEYLADLDGVTFLDDPAPEGEHPADPDPDAVEAGSGPESTVDEVTAPGPDVEAGPGPEVTVDEATAPDPDVEAGSGPEITVDGGTGPVGDGISALHPFLAEPGSADR
ncbi:MAG: hypothetical protein P8Z68_00975 [Kineosporiaceae bacterium]